MYIRFYPHDYLVVKSLLNGVNVWLYVPFPCIHLSISRLDWHRNGTTAEGTLAPPPQSQCLAAAGYPWPAETWVIDNQTIIPIGSMVLLYMVTFIINIPPMLAYIPYMDPMGLDQSFSQLVDDQMINLWCLKSILGSGIYSICRLLMAIDVLFPLVG